MAVIDKACDDNWDINNYLDDSTSLNPRRASGMSAHPPPSEYVKKDDAMHILFCEHQRITSKDSNGPRVVAPCSSFETGQSRNQGCN